MFEVQLVYLLTVSVYYLFLYVMLFNICWVEEQKMAEDACHFVVSCSLSIGVLRWRSWLYL